MAARPGGGLALIPLVSLFVTLSLAGGCGGSPSLSGPPPALIHRPAASAERSARANLAEWLSALESSTDEQLPALLERGQQLPEELYSDLARTLRSEGETPVVRAAAAFVLGEADRAAACTSLGLAWADMPEDPEVAIAVAVALSRCQDFAPLRLIVSAPGAELFRLKAAMALGLGGDTEALPQVAALAQQASASGRFFAVLAAALLVDEAAISAVETLFDELHSRPDELEGLWAVIRSRAGSLDALQRPALRSLAATGSEPALRQAALEELIRSADREADALLRRALQDGSRRNRSFAREELQRRGAL